jgi:hypothetical protein
MASSAHGKKLKLPTCEWSDGGEGAYLTECGEAFVVNEGTPAENGMRFCPYCGRKLKVVRHGRCVAVARRPIRRTSLS